VTKVKAASYPIIKYPPAILAKLKNKLPSDIASGAASPTESPDLFASFFIHPDQEKKIDLYPLYLLCLFWIGIATAIYFRKMNNSILSGCIALTIIAVVINSIILYKTKIKNDKLRNFNIDRKKSQKNIPKVKPQLVKDEQLIISFNHNIWRAEANKLLRSDKNSSANVGSSEKFFLKRLKAVFPQASFGFAYLPDGYTHPYSSDIEIILENGLGLQIEIDEPYVGKSREPHHCWDVGSDATRDAFFLRSGWIILRFSEHQIVTNPSGCIAVITRVAAKLVGNKQLSELDLLNNLKPERQWTVEEAKMLEKKKFRESYLSKEGLWNAPRSTKKTMKPKTANRR
jgi:hypothetical protein